MRIISQGSLPNEEVIFTCRLCRTVFAEDICRDIIRNSGFVSKCPTCGSSCWSLMKQVKNG